MSCNRSTHTHTHQPRRNHDAKTKFHFISCDLLCRERLRLALSVSQPPDLFVFRLGCARAFIVATVAATCDHLHIQLILSVGVDGSAHIEANPYGHAMCTHGSFIFAFHRHNFVVGCGYGFAFVSLEAMREPS